MTFDLNKYADDIVNSQFDRIDRDWIEEGTHIIRIESCDAFRGQNKGNDMVVMEGELVSTDSDTQKAGDKVKHIWSLSGVDAWKVKRNLAQLKSLVTATLPPEVANAVTADVIKQAISGGRDAIVCGAMIKIVAKLKTSKNDKQFLNYSFMSAPSSVTPSGWTVTETLEDDNDSEEIPF